MPAAVFFSCAVLIAGQLPVTGPAARSLSATVAPRRLQRRGSFISKEQSIFLIPVCFPCLGFTGYKYYISTASRQRALGDVEPYKGSGKKRKEAERREDSDEEEEEEEVSLERGQPESREALEERRMKKELVEGNASHYREQSAYVKQDTYVDPRAFAPIPAEYMTNPHAPVGPTQGVPLASPAAPQALLERFDAVQFGIFWRK